MTIRGFDTCQVRQAGEQNQPYFRDDASTMNILGTKAKCKEGKGSFLIHICKVWIHVICHVCRPTKTVSETLMLDSTVDTFQPKFLKSAILKTLLTSNIWYRSQLP